MSQAPDQPQPQPQSAPLPRATYPVPQSAPPAPRSGGFPVMGCFFGLSFLLNLLLGGVLLVFVCMGLAYSGNRATLEQLNEKHLLGKKGASDKVAVVALEGAIMEGMLTNFYKQLDQAAEDDRVKAVVLRVNSPGGSITASEEVHHKLIKLRDGDKSKDRQPKSLVVSMGSLTASGGYYVSMPASRIVAEPTTVTGSIGVYASFPNAAKLADTYGVTFNTIKAGEIKDSGALLRPMDDKERQVFQDMVDDAYVRFLEVIEKGRSKLTRAKMLERFTVTPLTPDPKALGDKPAPKPYDRYRADGGIYTAKRALDLGLIDAIGTLEDAVKEAAKLAKLDEYNAIQYKKPPMLADLLLGTKAPTSAPPSLDRLRGLLAPRMWYLAAGHEAAVRLVEGNQP